MPNWFWPLKSPPRPVEILGFDIEGRGGPDGFICGSIVGSGLASFYTDRESMMQDLLHHARDGAWVFAHNLQYDLPILEGPKFPRGDLLFTRDRLLWCDYEYYKRRVRVFDSGNLFPRYTVAMLGELVQYPKGELPEDLLRDLSRGRRWSEFFPNQQELIRSYNLRDSQIVYMAVSWLQEFTLSLGGQLQATISGVAMDLFRRKFHKWPWMSVGPKTNKFVRAGFYGGRVENFAVGRVKGVNMYDVTSLYPHAQHEARFPHPNHLKLELSPGLTGSYWKGEGMLAGTINIPPCNIPPLPYRYNKRLFFPHGQVSGQWSLYELRQAMTQGVQLLEVENVLWAEVCFNPFTDFIETLFARRYQFLNQHNPMANLAKLILNSLFGRWGLNPEGGLYKLVDLENVQDLSKFQGYQTEDIGGRLMAYGPIESKRFPSYVNVLFAAQISSVARCLLNEELQVQGDQAIYCDTDSIITRGQISTGSGLGEWRLEMQGGEVDLIGPKEYAIYEQNLEDRYVVKGVPGYVAREYFQTGVARFYKALGIREAINSGRAPAQWVETLKSRKDTFPKRYPLAPWRVKGLDFTPTRPYAAFELPLVTSGSYVPGEVEEAPPEPSLPWVGKLHQLTYLEKQRPDLEMP